MTGSNRGDTMLMLFCIAMLPVGAENSGATGQASQNSLTPS